MTGKPATGIALCIALLGALGACTTVPAQRATQAYEDCGASLGVAIRIAVDGDFALVEFANTSSRAFDLRAFPDQRDYMDGVLGIQVRRGEQVISGRDGARDGWWTPAILESRSYPVSEVIRIPVRAGETRQWRVEWRDLLLGLDLDEATGSEQFRLRTDFSLADGTRIACESGWLPLDSQRAG